MTRPHGILWLFVVLFGCAGQLLMAAQAKELLPEQITDPNRNQVVFIGDSETYGGNVVSSEDQTFPALLDKYFFENSLPYTSVNAGVNGDSTIGVLGRLDQYLNQRTALIVLEIGLNDLFRKEPSDQIKARLRAILEKIKRHNIPVVLCTFTWPIPRDVLDRQFMAVYPELATEFSLSTLEVINDWKTPRIFSADHVHFSDYGHALIASRLLPVLNPKWGASTDDLIVTEAMVRGIPYWVAREARATQ